MGNDWSNDWSDYFDVDWTYVAPFAGDFADLGDIETAINIVLSLICVVCAGLAAGLTMGLLSIETTKLEIKRITGTDEEKHDVDLILPIVKEHHLLLCTLLLFNSLANEALPVFLDSLVPNWLAIVMSVTLVLLFGEILPSAFFTGPRQLHVAATFIPFVKGLITFLYPIAYPLSVALDYFFGKEEDSCEMTRDELGALVMLQVKSYDPGDSPQHFKESPSANDEDDEGLSGNEVKILTGMLQLSKLFVRETMIPIKCAFMISDSTRLDGATVDAIWNQGFSRVPVFKRKDKQHILGYLLVKSLILVNPEDKIAVESLPIREPLFVKPDTSLLEILSVFRRERSHLAMVTENPRMARICFHEERRPTDNAAIIGIITMEDVIEQMFGDIKDETDDVFTTSHFTTSPTKAKKRADQGMGLLSMGRSSIIKRQKRVQGKVGVNSAGHVFSSVPLVDYGATGTGTGRSGADKVELGGGFLGSSTTEPQRWKRGSVRVDSSRRSCSIPGDPDKTSISLPGSAQSSERMDEADGFGMPGQRLARAVTYSGGEFDRYTGEMVPSGSNRTAEGGDAVEGSPDRLQEQPTSKIVNGSVKFHDIGGYE